MKIQMTDLCGRESPRVGEPDELGLTDDDLDHCFDMWAEGRPAYIGEFEYREVIECSGPVEMGCDCAPDQCQAA